jgi:uncharacterized protein YecE (DUF72 family)
MTAPANRTDEGILPGCQGYNFPQWKAAFYPIRLSPGQYLAYYSRIFPYLELDSSFFVSPRPETVRAWHRQTPADFRISLRLPAEISHRRAFTDCTGELLQFLEAATLLEDKLAPIIIETDPAMDSSHASRLVSFLDALPRDFRFAIDFRHPTWFCTRTYDMLRTFGIALCLVDHPLLDRELQLTAPFSVIRLCGDEQARPASQSGRDREEDLLYFRNQARALQRQGQVYLSCSNHWNGFAPASMARLARLLDQTLPAYGEAQQDLFPAMALESLPARS